MGRLILLPGLGADERMFENLGDVDPAPLAPRHLVPLPGECLEDYATRVADWLVLKSDDVVGGSSFGGLVASAVARQRRVKGLVLIGGALHAEALAQSGLLRFVPTWLLRPMLHSDRLTEKVFAPESQAMRRLARSMLDDAPEELLLRGSRMMWRYRPAAAIRCPVFAIHGGMDPVMSPPPVAGCRLVDEAGHGIAWTHGELVGRFLREALDACARGASGQVVS